MKAALQARLRQEHREAGETLLEVIIASALMGVVVVAIIGGLASTVLGAHIHRDQTDANVVLVSGMERIKSTDFDYSNVDCGKSTTERADAYEAKAAEAVPASWPGSGAPYFQATVLFENVALEGGVPKISFTSSCVPGLRRQLVTLTLTTPDGHVTRALSFIKGDV